MDYGKMKIAELRALVAERGIRNSEGMKKNELIELLNNIDKFKNQAKDTPKKEEEPKTKGESKTVEDSKANGESKTVEKKTSEEKNGVEKKNGGRTSAKSNVRSAVKSDVRPTAKSDVRPTAKSDVRPTAKTEAKSEINIEGTAEGKTENTAVNSEVQKEEEVVTKMLFDGQEYDPRLASGEKAKGILEIMADGYGFIRSDNYMPGEKDVYISPMQIRRYGLRTGDIISGPIKKKTQMNEKFGGLLYLETVNGMLPSSVIGRKKFDYLTPVFPDERIRLDYDKAPISLRIVDLFSPIGKGQRGMIVSPPKAGKTTLLKQVAKRINTEYPNISLLVLLIDERPEEVTDIKESIEGKNAEVIYSTFDETPDHHKRVSEMVIERAKRLVESGKDVVILLDSITRLARAYNLTVTPSGRTLSGGLDPAALHMPKKFFGAARNMREGGSLTILATALIETGSRLDDVVFEEFKGTGNMELILDRGLSERRVFPAIDIPRSGTRRDDLLLDAEEKEALDLLHREMRGPKVDDFTEELIRLFKNTKNNKELVQYVLKTYRNRR